MINRLGLAAILLLLCGPLFSQGRTEEKALQEELYQDIRKMASSYYAYPGPLASQTPAPAGYAPVYISHYSRHGSRYITEESRYTDVIDVFRQNELTELGRDVLCRLDSIYAHAMGKAGELTALGERQHEEVACRMVSSFPAVFRGNGHVHMVSSTSRRCMMSMLSFSLGLARYNSGLVLERSAYERDMCYINNETPEYKSFNSKTSEWYKGFKDLFNRTVHPERLLAALFVHPEKVKDGHSLMDGLYWIAANQQDVVPDDIDLYGIFTRDELYAMWKAVNYRMYIANADAPVSNGLPMLCAHNLLENIISEADMSLATGRYRASLRFGHDSALMKLLALMRIDGCAPACAKPDEYHLYYQDFRIVPMCANLQLVFFRNRAGHVLVKIMLNENEVTVPIDSEKGHYYDWNRLRQFWIDQMR